MTDRQTRRRPGVMALCAGVGLALALAGCGGGSDDAKPQTAPSAASTAPPAVSASPPDPDAADKTAVLASYTAMWVEQMKAYRKASPDGTKLDDYATLDALSAFERDLAHMKKSGTIGTGQLGHEPEVAELDMEAKIPTATVEDCIDLSKWKAERTPSGEVVPLPTAQPLRYVATATVERWDNERWMVTAYKPDGSRSC
ncbi:hypothetical protein [Streptomyces sp. NBC_00887]|uniref:hypothetical protein n=1 Tax=Streptomyces sp. NBC_00887 TaxID=2975859 RepID=UPI00386348B4|nr:hypothetical protein OG844_46325 [Streptomyces sp. NBC_00887]